MCTFSSILDAVDAGASVDATGPDVSDDVWETVKFSFEIEEVTAAVFQKETAKVGVQPVSHHHHHHHHHNSPPHQHHNHHRRRHFRHRSVAHRTETTMFHAAQCSCERTLMAISTMAMLSLNNCLHLLDSLLSVLEITVGHRTLSDQISKLSDQFYHMVGHDV